MTKEQYLRTLKKLDLTPASKLTAHLLDLSVRQLMRISAGDTPVPRYAAMLLELYRRHGIPKDWRI